MASLRVLAFDHEGRPLQFDTWLDDLQLYLLSDSRDSISLFDHTSGAAPAPPNTADNATRSQWLTHDAAARLAIRNHLPLAECAHLGQQRTAQILYDVVVARYSSPATAALGCLLLPKLFPDLSAFATIEDLVCHLRASVARYRAALPAEFLDRNPPPMYITLYFIVTRLPDSLHSVRDHFLTLDPTSLTVDLLKQHLLAAETSAVAVGAARGTPRSPFFEGCSPSPLAPSYTSAAAIDILSTEDVEAASASTKRRSGKGKGGRGGGGGSGSGGGGRRGGSGGSGGGGSGGSGGGSGGVGGSGGGSGGSGSSGSGGNGGGDHAGQTCGNAHTQHRCFSRLNDAWRAEFGDEVKRPHWAGLLRTGVAIFDLDYDAILSAMYALSAIAEGDYSRCVPPDPGIEAAALGASESVLPGTAPAEALHTFTLDSGASRCFFRDSTTVTPLPAPVPVRLADPSRGPIVARSSTVLPCPAVPSSSLSGLHLPSFSTNLRVSICTCTWTGRLLAMFTRPPGSSLYTLATEPSQVAASAQVSASGQVAPPCSCRLLSHQTLLWHHRLGQPSLPRLRGMHSRLLESARVSGQGCEHYFLLVVDEYTRYTTVVPLRSKGQVPLQPASPLPTPSPYTEQSGGLIERREPASRLVSPIRPARRVPRSRPPPVPGTHAMAFRPSSVPLRVPLPAPPESSLPEVPDPESDRIRATNLIVSRLLAGAVTDPSFESATVSALVAELLDFAAACRLDYATTLVAQSASASPSSVGGECALDTDILEDRQEDFECLAAAVPRFASMLLAPKGDPDAPDILTPRSYAKAITGPSSS
ncbi:unnamed protein product [Closterium sp. NIES-53]